MSIASEIVDPKIFYESKTEKSDYSSTRMAVEKCASNYNQKADLHDKKLLCLEDLTMQGDDDDTQAQRELLKQKRRMLIKRYGVETEVYDSQLENSFIETAGFIATTVVDQISAEIEENGNMLKHMSDEIKGERKPMQNLLGNSFILFNNFNVFL